MKIETVKIGTLKPHPANPRTHPDSAIEKLAKSIQEFGWTSPILISEDNFIVAGHARLKAAMKAKRKSVPIIRLPLSGNKALAYMVADNRLQDLTEFDYPKLKDLITEIDSGKFDITLTAFDEKELKGIFDYEGDKQQDGSAEGSNPKIITCPECGHEFEA